MRTWMVHPFRWLGGAVLSVGGGVHNDNPNRDYLHLGILDRSGNQAVEKMTQVMLQAIENSWYEDNGWRMHVLQAAQKCCQSCSRSILVHCRGGINRSPATIAAFLMATEYISWEEEAMADTRHSSSNKGAQEMPTKTRIQSCGGTSSCSLETKIY